MAALQWLRRLLLRVCRHYCLLIPITSTGSARCVCYSAAIEHSTRYAQAHLIRNRRANKWNRLLAEDILVHVWWENQRINYHCAVLSVQRSSLHPVESKRFFPFHNTQLNLNIVSWLCIVLLMLLRRRLRSSLADRYFRRFGYRNEPCVFAMAYEFKVWDTRVGEPTHLNSNSAYRVCMTLH